MYLGPHNPFLGQDDLVFPIPLTVPLATPGSQGPPQVLSDPWHIFQSLLHRPLSSPSRSFTVQQPAWHSKCSSVLSGGLGTLSHLSRQTGSSVLKWVHWVTLQFLYSVIKYRAHHTVDSFVPSLHKFLFQMWFAWCRLSMQSPILRTVTLNEIYI